MIRIGMIAALEGECVKLYNRLGSLVTVEEYEGFKIRKYIGRNRIFLLATTGVGEVNAALATQYMLSNNDVDYLINFGLVGSLKGRYKRGMLTLVDSIVHYDFSLNTLDKRAYGRYPGRDTVEFYTNRKILSIASAVEPDMPHVKLASGDKFIALSSMKKWLVGEFNADICDMEAYGIYTAAKRAGVECLFIKSVSDNADEDANESFDEVISEGVSTYVDFVSELTEKLAAKKEVRKK